MSPPAKSAPISLDVKTQVNLDQTSTRPGVGPVPQLGSKPGSKLDVKPAPLKPQASTLVGQRMDARPNEPKVDGKLAGNLSKLDPKLGAKVAALSANNPALDQTLLAPSAGSPSAPIPAPVSGGSLSAPVPAPAAGAAASAARPERKSEGSGSRDDMVGRTLNKRYVVGEKVGEGGFGAVFRGKQLATGREVALKILHPYNLGDPTIVARFRREAEACSLLRNPHTVITYDFDETEDGVLYLAMEMLHGRSLHHLERAEGHLDPDRVLRIIDQVAEALGEAHQHGIVHRDMKPENVFIEDRGGADYVKVLDFGIAKMMTDERGQAALTAVGQTLGTLEFMSPEQLRGLPLDGRSDIYALGIMAYEMLTGELPFKDAKTPVQIINFHMQKPAPPPSRLKPALNIPGYVDEVILKMVAKAREDRYADTNALREHISRVLKGADKRVDRFEAYRLVGVVGAAALIISALVYFLSR
ncbi:MAG TPA: serine/threonine-protein kinase [Polyangia bacterium]